ncbi:MAG: hypothetical protein KF862_00015 [Chitinophagaceae bacterium]|nr:hypothetical protein [Chitinophagaceae bacterium]
MRKTTIKMIGRYLAIIIFFAVAGYYLLGYISSYIGWYGYKKGTYRVSTLNINESKKRGVFVKELNFSIHNFNGSLESFSPYIEKGFKYGRHSSQVTDSLKNSEYPYQLSFPYRPTPQITVTIKKEDLIKFDSSDNVWGYLKYPFLKDTIILEIRGENVRNGTIKVWE